MAKIEEEFSSRADGQFDFLTSQEVVNFQYRFASTSRHACRIRKKFKFYKLSLKMNFFGIFESIFWLNSSEKSN